MIEELSQGLLELLLTNATGALLLAVLAAFVAPRLKRPELVRNLWLLVLLRLLAPPVLILGLPWLPAIAAGTQLPSGEPALHLDAQRFESASRLPIPPETMPGLAFGLAALWSAGALVVLLVAALRTAAFQRHLCEHGREDPALQRRVDNLSRKLGVNRPPRLTILENGGNPVLWALFGRARLVIPQDLEQQLDQEELDTLFLHELAHLRRRDPWVRYLELLASSVYWWFPPIHWVRAKLHRAEEQCCDQLVTGLMPSSRRAYARCLLITARYSSAKSNQRPVLATGFAQTSDLEERLTMIMTRNQRPRLTLPVRFALIVAASTAVAVFPSLVQPPVAANEGGQSIQLDLRDTTLGEGLRQLASSADINLLIEPGVDLQRKVDLRLESSSWRQGLATLLRGSNLEWRIEGKVVWIYWGGFLKDSLGPFSGEPIDLSLKDADLRQTLEEFSQISGLPMQIEEEVAGRITVELKQVPWDQALDAMLRVHRLQGTVQEGVLSIRNMPRQNNGD